MGLGQSGRVRARLWSAVVESRDDECAGGPEAPKVFYEPRAYVMSLEFLHHDMRRID
jgi:hypothetical protein